MDEVAEDSDALMERYLEGEEISHEEIVNALKDGTNHGQHLPGHLRRRDAQPRHQPPARRDRRGPALARQARRRSSVGEIDARARRGRASCSPTSSRRAPTRSPGRINLFRVYQGVMTPRHARCSTPAPTPRSASASCSCSRGKEVEPRRRVRPGRHRRRGQAQGDPRRRLAGRPRRADRDARDRSCPRRSWRSRSSPRAKGDEDKVFTALRRLQEEDPTIDLHRDPQTGEQIVAGLSQIHVEVIVDRLQVALRRRGRRSSRRACPTRRRSAAAPRPTGATRSSPAAAASSATATSRSSRCRDGDGLRVRQRDQGRRDPARASSRRSRRACARRWRTGAVAGYPVKGVRVRLFDGQLPHGRLLRDGVQARRLAWR